DDRASLEGGVEQREGAVTAEGGRVTNRVSVTLSVGGDSGRPVGRRVSMWPPRPVSSTTPTSSGSRCPPAGHLALGIESGQPDPLLLYGALIATIRYHQGRLPELVELIDLTRADNPGVAM